MTERQDLKLYYVSLDEATWLDNPMAAGSEDDKNDRDIKTSSVPKDYHPLKNLF